MNQEHASDITVLVAMIGNELKDDFNDKCLAAANVQS